MIGLLPEPVAAKVPAVAARFWVMRLLITAGGAAAADYLARRSHVRAALAAAGLMIAALVFFAAVGAAGSAAGLARRRRLPTDEPPRGRAGRMRRGLGQAVGEAEFAVLAAQVTGAPARELDTLCQRLRLAAEAAGPAQPTADLIAAARMIQHAAAAAIAALPKSGAGPRAVDRPAVDRPAVDRTAADEQCAAIAALIARAVGP